MSETTDKPKLGMRAPLGLKRTVEVSTAGLHKPVGELYPHPDFLRACRVRGVPVTLGSDAHSPDLVGRDFDRARELLTSAGYETITVFERPWLKLCFTLPTSTVRFRPSGARIPSFGLSVVSLTQNPSFKSQLMRPQRRPLAQHHVR